MTTFRAGWLKLAFASFGITCLTSTPSRGAEDRFFVPVSASASTASIVAPQPARLGWTSPDTGFWLTGESGTAKHPMTTDINGINGQGSVGLRQQLLSGSPIVLTVTSMIRAAANWDNYVGEGGHNLGGALTAEVSLPVAHTLRFTASAGAGDRNGVSAPNATSSPLGGAVRTQAGLSGDLSTAGAKRPRFNLQVITTRALSTLPGEAFRPSSCEIALAITSKEMAPLNISASCPGRSGEGRITFNIAGRF